MQRAGVLTVSLVLYVIFILGGTCLCFSALAFAGHFIVWRGLEFPVDLGTALRLLGLSASAFLIGTLLYRFARRLL